MAERMHTIKAAKGSNIVLPCSLTGDFTFPEWQGPPNDAYYTNQGQNVLNQQIPSISEGRLSWHANQADLNLQNVMESDQGSYKCFFKGLGIFKVELLVSGINSTVPDLPRNAGDGLTIAMIIFPIVVWMIICSLGIWCLYSKYKHLQGNLCSLKMLLFLATFYLLLGWIIWICNMVCFASKTNKGNGNDGLKSVPVEIPGQRKEQVPLVSKDLGTSRENEDDEDSDTHLQILERIFQGITGKRENEYQIKGASIEGLRVVRGPNWNYGNKDGGEGYVGTITNDNKDGTVEVQWDMGERRTFNTGKDNKFDLGILDSASTGLKHFNVTCDGCKDHEFPGTRWKCQMCDNFDLCSKCYFSDLDDVNHNFIRIDGPGLFGIDVPARQSSKKFRAKGIFKNAKVNRGKDWSYGDQDGGNGQIGTVFEVQTSSVGVMWPNGTKYSYRLGLEGKVDLTCVKESDGMFYYKDHLLSLNTKSVPPTAEKPAFCKGIKPQIGDKVCVMLPEMALKELQKGHGGWSIQMKQYIGQHGTLTKIEDNGDCNVDFHGAFWRFHPDAIGKVPLLKIGDTVRIIDNKDQAIALQKCHGGWIPEMQQVLGKVGKVVKVDSDGNITVLFGIMLWVFNAAACQPAPGALVDDIKDGINAISKQNKSGETGFDSTDGDKRDLASAATSQLIAQLCMLQSGLLAGLQSSLQSVKGAKELISAAAINDLRTVDALIKENPNLIDQKDQGVTALIIAAHEGHDQIVSILLKAGANKDLTEKQGNPALMAALMKKRETSACLLIEAGANVNLSNDQNMTALHFAAATSSNESLKMLLKKNADPNKQDIAGDTPLHDAISNKNDAGVVLLVTASSMNLQLCNKQRFSPLHFAAFKDNEFAVTRILSRAPELKDSRMENKYTPLHIAAINDNTEVVKALLKAKVNVEATSHSGSTALHLAAQQGYIETAKLLIEASAKVNAKDEDGDTPLHECVKGHRNRGEDDRLAQLFGITTNASEIKERIELACLLIKQGAFTNIKNKHNRTPLECCTNNVMRNAIAMFAQPKSTGANANLNTDAESSTSKLTRCAICKNNSSDVKFLPCDHKVCCRHCSLRVRECPICDLLIIARVDLDGNMIEVHNPCETQ